MYIVGGGYWIDHGTGRTGEGIANPHGVEYLFRSIVDVGRPRRSHHSRLMVLLMVPGVGEGADAISHQQTAAAVESRSHCQAVRLSQQISYSVATIAF